jgi:hypothetical protein
VRRRGDLTGWILMGVLFIAAMGLIFYILLLRAQHLSSMEQQRINPEPEAVVERVIIASTRIVHLAADSTSSPVPHVLVVPH